MLALAFVELTEFIAKTYRISNLSPSAYLCEVCLKRGESVVEGPVAGEVLSPEPRRVAAAGQQGQVVVRSRAGALRCWAEGGGGRRTMRETAWCGDGNGCVDVGVWVRGFVAVWVYMLVGRRY